MYFPLPCLITRGYIHRLSIDYPQIIHQMSPCFERYSVLDPTKHPANTRDLLPQSMATDRTGPLGRWSGNPVVKQDELYVYIYICIYVQYMCVTIYILCIYMYNKYTVCIISINIPTILVIVCIQYRLIQYASYISPLFS